MHLLYSLWDIHTSCACTPMLIHSRLLSHIIVWQMCCILSTPLWSHISNAEKDDSGILLSIEAGKFCTLLVIIIKCSSPQALLGGKGIGLCEKLWDLHYPHYGYQLVWSSWAVSWSKGRAQAILLLHDTVTLTAWLHPSKTKVILFISSWFCNAAKLQSKVHVAQQKIFRVGLVLMFYVHLLTVLCFCWLNILKKPLVVCLQQRMEILPYSSSSQFLPLLSVGQWVYCYRDRCTDVLFVYVHSHGQTSFSTMVSVWL